MSGDEFVYRRVHHASRELLFECLTTPEHLTHFWGPIGMVTPLDGIVVDLRPGGAFETRMVAEHGDEQHVLQAVYEVVEPPRRLVWRETESGMVTTVTLIDLGDGTTEVVTHQRHVPETYATPEARAGWATSLDRFARYVETIAPTHGP